MKDQEERQNESVKNFLKKWKIVTAGTVKPDSAAVDATTFTNTERLKLLTWSMYDAMKNEIQLKLNSCSALVLSLENQLDRQESELAKRLFEILCKAGTELRFLNYHLHDEIDEFLAVFIIDVA
jgi:hypothetical protein